MEILQKIENTLAMRKFLYAAGLSPEQVLELIENDFKQQKFEIAQKALKEYDPKSEVLHDLCRPTTLSPSDF